MRRRRDEGDACRSMTGLGDIRIDFIARQMAAFARFSPLGALDLQFIGVDEVVAGDAETGRCDLFDAVVRFRIETGRVFAAFAGIAHAAQAVHGRSDTFMGFLAEGAVTHGTRAEALDDGIDRFDFFDRDAAAGRIFKVQEVAQAENGLTVDMVGVFFIRCVVAGLDGFLQELDRFRVDDVRLAALVVLVEVAPFQFISRAVRFLVAQGIFLGDFSDAQAFDAGRCVAEIFVDQVLFDADGFKNLCAVVAVDCRNAHLGHDGQDAFDGGVDVVLFGRFVIDFLELLVGNEFLDGFQGDVRVDGRNAVADEGTEMMDFARFARFQDEADVGADGLIDEIMVQGCRGQEGRNGGHARVDAAVGQDEDVGAVLDGLQGIDAERFDGRFHAFSAAVDGIEHGQRSRPQFRSHEGLDDRHLFVGQNRAFEVQGCRRRFVRFHDVGDVAGHDS